MIFFKQPYHPLHRENKMRDEGDVMKGRNDFFNRPSNNLKFLLEQRLGWMNKFIKNGDKGIELGSGMGLSKLFIKNKNLLLTDYADYEWLDVKNVDALNTPFDKESFDFVIACSVIHHLSSPKKFFKEMHRILKPNGFLLIYENNVSLLMRIVLRLMRHEGYDFGINVFDETVCTNPDDLWSGNGAIANCLFDDRKRFEKEIPYFEIRLHKFTECCLFLNSGGVSAKTFFIPLPMAILHLLKIIDEVMIKFPRLFALQRKVVLQKCSI